MARRPGTELINWDAQMEKEAAVATAMEAGAAGSTFFSLRGGILALNGMAIPGNQIAAVILDSILENVYYPGAFNPDAMTPPKCFAFARSESEMRPHDVVFEAGQQENDTCAGCPQNEFGTSERGRGKACSNRRRLSVLAAGMIEGNQFEPYDDEHFATAPIALLKLPVTSVRPYASFVNQIGNVLKRPPYGVFTSIKVEPNPKTQFQVTCTLIDKVPNRLLPIITKRRVDTQSILEQPYMLEMEEAPPPPPAKKGRKY